MISSVRSLAAPVKQPIENEFDSEATSGRRRKELWWGSTIVFCVVLFLAVTDVATVVASELMLHYDFDEVESPSVKDRSGSGLDAVFDGFNGLGAKGPRSRLGWGVSGSQNDRSFDNTAATGMGSKGTGGRLRTPKFYPGKLDSFTITGWFKTEGNVWLDHLARIISIKGKQHLLLMAVNGQLVLKIGHSSFISAAAYHETSKWVFFAVSYDGTLPPAADNVRFYVGSTTEPVRLADRGSLLPPLGAWTVSDRGSEIAWGNGVGKKSIGNRPLDGFMDDLRFYGTRNGSGGALDGDRLEQVRRSALAKP